jgi:threonine/homoserine/homoserine lactone efflux protein
MFREHFNIEFSFGLVIPPQSFSGFTDKSYRSILEWLLCSFSITVPVIFYSFFVVVHLAQAARKLKNKLKVKVFQKNFALVLCFLGKTQKLNLV